MFRVLFLLFIIVPIIEIMVLINVGAWLGAWPTIAIVIITAWLGAKNVKQQGIATLNSVQTKMAQGEMPSDEIVAGLLLLVAGVLLVTPGFVTDFFGLSLLIPQVRKALINSVQQHLKTANVNSGSGFSFYSQTFNQNSFDQSPFNNETNDLHDHKHKGQTLDGEFERKD
ncbi:MAG: FxsA family protein [Thalassotalea sp.]|nr:FxsA family protein [Thalassotalea sp.]